MKEKYDQRYEKQIKELADSRIKTGKYKMLDDRTRIITRKIIDGKDCLMIASSDGEVLALSPVFQMALLTALETSK